MVGKSRNDKGKNMMEENTEKSTSTNVHCHNGFTPIRILSDPLVELNKVPLSSCGILRGLTKHVEIKRD